MANVRLRDPWMHSIILTTQSTAYNLYTLCHAITAELQTWAQSVQIQLDPGAGGAKLYVGSPDTLATNDCGVVLFASQAFGRDFFTSNGLKLDDIELMSDTAGVQVNVSITIR